MRNFKKNKYRKLIFLAMSASMVVLSSCAPVFFQNESAQISTNTINKLDDKTLATFNGKNYTLSNGINDYLKSISGVKSLTSNFTNLLIKHFYDSLINLRDSLSQDGSLIVTNKLLGQLSSVQSGVEKDLENDEKTAKEAHSSNGARALALQKVYDGYGGSISRYKFFKSLSKLREFFIDDLLADNYLNYDNLNSIDSDTLNKPDNWNKIKFSNDTLNDPIAKIFSHFQQFLFEDWFTYTNPVPVIEINWNYASKDVRDPKANDEILKSIYDENKLSLQGIKLPESSNYNFPAFDDVSNSSSNTGNNFKNFITNFEDLIDSNKITKSIKNYSDDDANKWSVVSLNDLGNMSDNSSQKTAAILQVYNTFAASTTTSINSLDIASVDKDHLLKNFLKFSTTAASGTAEVSTAASSTDSNNQVGIQISGNTLFKANTDYTKESKFPEEVYDLRQFTSNKKAKESRSEAKSAENENKQWVLFKDDKGAHALTIDGVSNLSNDKNYFKNFLLWRGMSNKNNLISDDGVNYDLLSDLKKYLSDNFDAIILRYLIKTFSSSLQKTEKTSEDKESPDTILKKANESRNNREKLSLTNASLLNTEIFNGRLNDQTTFLFNGTYNPFWSSSDIKSTRDSKLVALLTSASELLNAVFFKNKLFSLREKLTASYQNFIDTDSYQKDSKHYANLNNGLASKLPYKLNYETTKEVTNYAAYKQENDGGYSELEKSFLFNANAAEPKARMAMAATDADSTKTKNLSEAIYSKYFTPGTIVKNFSDYLSKLQEYFSQTFLTDFSAYDSEELRNSSKVLHFNTPKTFQVKMLLIQSVDQNLLEAIRIEIAANGNLANTIKQVILYDQVVKNYYDYQKNCWKISDSLKPADWAYGTNFVSEFKSNFMLSFVNEDYINKKIRQIFGGYKYEDNKDKEGFAKLLEKIRYQNYFVNSDDGINYVGNKLQSDYKVFLAINWLLKDNLINFRNYLENFIGNNGVAGFVWTNQTRKTSSLNSDFGTKKFGDSSDGKSGDNDYKFSQNPNNEIDTPYILEKPFASIQDFNLAKNNWSFADIKKASYSSGSGTSSATNNVGFKGLLTPANAETAVGPKIAGLLFNNFQSSLSSEDNQGILYNWVSFNNLVKIIKNAKTFLRLTSITESLAKAFPNISFANVNRAIIKSPIENSKAINLSLQQRINALLNIVYGYDYQYRVDSEKIFNQSVKFIYNTTPTTQNACNGDNGSNSNSSCSFDSKNRISNQNFQQFTGSIKNGIINSNSPFAISESSSSFINNVAYLQQINTNDVNSAENFKAFMNKISADVFFQTLFKAAQDLSVQSKALFDFLNHTQFKKIIVYDQDLKTYLGNDWSVAYIRQK